MKRAKTVAAILTRNGVDASILEITSHGKNNPSSHRRPDQPNTKPPGRGHGSIRWQVRTGLPLSLFSSPARSSRCSVDDLSLAPSAGRFHRGEGSTTPFSGPPPTSGAGPIAIVDLDETSLERLGQWPWPRTGSPASSTGFARRRDAVGLDMVFAEPDGRRLPPSPRRSCGTRDPDRPRGLPEGGAGYRSGLAATLAGVPSSLATSSTSKRCGERVYPPPAARSGFSRPMGGRHRRPLRCPWGSLQPARPVEGGRFLRFFNVTPTRTASCAAFPW